MQKGWEKATSSHLTLVEQGRKSEFFFETGCKRWDAPLLGYFLGFVTCCDVEGDLGAEDLMDPKSYSWEKPPEQKGLGLMPHSCVWNWWATSQCRLLSISQALCPPPSPLFPLFLFFPLTSQEQLSLQQTNRTKYTYWVAESGCLPRLIHQHPPQRLSYRRDAPFSHPGDQFISMDLYISVQIVKMWMLNLWMSVFFHCSFSLLSLDSTISWPFSL